MPYVQPNVRSIIERQGSLLVILATIIDSSKGCTRFKFVRRFDWCRGRCNLERAVREDEGDKGEGGEESFHYALCW